MPAALPDRSDVLTPTALHPPPPVDLVVAAIRTATAATMRMASEWFGTEADSAHLCHLADVAEHGDLSWSCPVCEKVECKGHCPLAQIRAGLA